jgi:imidazolonepropionase-like amidohydrolase
MPGFIDAHRHIINGNDQQWFKDRGSAVVGDN